jgi:hypothetical protein
MGDPSLFAPLGLWLWRRRRACGRVKAERPAQVHSDSSILGVMRARIQGSLRFQAEGVNGRIRPDKETRR